MIRRPPRSTRTYTLFPYTTLFRSIGASTAWLKQALERAVPRTLRTINRRERECVKPQRVKLFGKKVEGTPPIACTIVGRVPRGPLRTEERRVGQACVSTSRSRKSTKH